MIHLAYDVVIVSLLETTKYLFDREYYITAEITNKYARSVYSSMKYRSALFLLLLLTPAHFENKLVAC